MQITINNQKVAIEKMGYNSGLNFGRFKNKDTIVTYQLEISKIQFFSILQKKYEQVKAEVKADDIKYKDSSDFKEVNYCSLTDLLLNTQYLTSIFETYLRDDFFNEIINFDTDNTYVINSILEVKFDKNISITGEAYAKKVN